MSKSRLVEYQELLKELLTDLQKVTVIALEQSGVERSSNLSKSVSFVVLNKEVNMVVAYYYHYVSTGRKRNVRKVPIKALIEYIKRKGITPRGGKTVNQLAFAIQQSIYKHGIRPKNFEDKIANMVADITEERMADLLIQEIANNLVQMFP